MRYQLCALRLALRSQLRRRGIWVFFAAMAALALFCRVSARSAAPEAVVRIGLVLPDGGGEDFCRALEANGSDVIEFVPADEAAAEGEVAAGHWDCALVLAEDYAERMARTEYEALVTVLRGPSSALAPLVREPAAAAIARRAAPDIALAYLRRVGAADEGALAMAREKLAAGLSDEQRVRVLAQTADGEPLDAVRLTRLGVSRALRGTLAAALLTWMLFAAADLARWRRTEEARRLAPCMTEAALLLPRLLARALPALCAGALALLAAGGATVRGTAALALYLAFTCALALALIVHVRAENAALLIPFAAAACILLSPVLADPAALYPKLAPLFRCMPVTLYLRAGDGSGGAAAQLLVVTLLLAAAAALPGKKRKC